MAIMVGLYCFFTYFKLPIGLTAALILFVFLLYFTVSKYKALDKNRKICFVGLTLSMFILSTLFGYKHFVFDISINTLHIGVIVLAPLLLWQYLEKKSKN
jgi:hypothetical protein